MQDPISVLQVVWRESNGDIMSVRVNRSVAVLACLEAWEAPRPSRIAVWWSAMAREVPSRSDLVSTAVHTLEVVWFLSANLVGLGTPTLADLTGRERRARRSGGVVVQPRRAGRNAVRMAISIGAMCSVKYGTTRCRYWHLC